MAAATATKSTSRGYLYSIGVIIFFVGFNYTLAQDRRFRINVYDDYHQQPLQDYEDYQFDGNQDYRAEEKQNYRQPSQLQSQNFQTNQQQNEYFKGNHQQNVNYQHQTHHYQPKQHQNPNVANDRYDSEYQKQYQQQFEDNYKAQYLKSRALLKKKPKKEGQDFSKIPGVPGIDFPIYHTIPKTSFSCALVPYLPGMYANVEAGCQVYHVCHDGREGDQGASFLCTNGTLFNQNEFACDWWYNVKCHDSFRLYSLNGDATTNPFVPKTKQDEILKGRDIEQKLKIVVS